MLWQGQANVDYEQSLEAKKAYNRIVSSKVFISFSLFRELTNGITLIIQCRSRIASFSTSSKILWSDQRNKTTNCIIVHSNLQCNTGSTRASKCLHKYQPGISTCICPHHDVQKAWTLHQMGRNLYMTKFLSYYVYGCIHEFQHSCEILAVRFGFSLLLEESFKPNWKLEIHIVRL